MINIDYLRSQFSDMDVCYFPIFNPIVCVIFSIIWIALFTMCPRGGSTISGYALKIILFGNNSVENFFNFIVFEFQIEETMENCCSSFYFLLYLQYSLPNCVFKLAIRNECIFGNT